MSEPVLNRFQIAFGVARAQGSRNYQEDEYTCVDNLTAGKGPAMFSLYDGHGTGNIAADCSDHVHEMLLESNFMNGDIDKAIRFAFKHQDARLNRYMKLLRSDVAGCTGTIAVVTEHKVHVGNLGDSRAIVAVLNDNNELHPVRLSKDHHPNDPEEKKRVTDAGGLIYKGRIIGAWNSINMSRALGDMNFKAPRNHSTRDFISADPTLCTPFDVTEKLQFLIVASDGLWNEAGDEEIIQLVKELREQGLGPEKISHKVVKKYSQGPRTDNVTMILVLFEWNPMNYRQYTPTSAREPGCILKSEHYGATILLPKDPGILMRRHSVF